MPDVETILRNAQIPQDARADAWDAFHQSTDAVDLTNRLNKLNLPQSVKADLWDAKSGGTTPAATPPPAAQAAPSNVSLGGFLGNTITSGANFLGGLGHAIAHPLDTASALASTAAGEILPDAVSQKIGQGLQLMNMPNAAKVMQQAPAAAKAVNQFYKNRYGGISNIANTAYADPIGLLSDLSGVADLGGGLLGVASKAADIAGASGAASAATKAATIAQKAAEITNPINAVVAPAKMIAGTSVANRLNPVQQAAINYGNRVGLPTDAAMATGSRYLQGMKTLLRNIPASGADEQMAAQTEKIAAHLDSLGPTMAPNANTTRAGTGQGLLNSRDARLGDYAQGQRANADALLQRAAQNPQVVPTGMKPSGLFAPNGTPQMTPTFETIEGPVSYTGAQAANQPLLDRFDKVMNIVKQKESPTYDLMRDIAARPSTVDLDTALSDYSGLGEIAGEEKTGRLKGYAQKVAGQLREPLGQAIDASVQQLGPGAVQNLDQMRNYTKLKYDLAGALPVPPSGSVGALDPTALADRILQPGDAGFASLDAVRQHNLGNLNDIRGTLLNELISSVRQGGDIERIQSSINRWESMGPKTKAALFTPAEQDAIKNSLEYAKLAKFNTNTSGSGPMAAIAALGGGMLAHPLNTVGTLMAGRAMANRIFNPAVAQALGAGAPILPRLQGPLARATGLLANPTTLNIGGMQQRATPGLLY